VGERRLQRRWDQVQTDELRKKERKERERKKKYNMTCGSHILKQLL
jgi:hypothetical protein